MKPKHILLILLIVSAVSISALADPPERVARLNYVQGDVTFRPAGIDDWTDAALNRPLIADDELWTDIGSRAELHLGSSAVRLGEQTSFSFLALDDGIAQIRLSRGTIGVRVRGLAEDETFEIDTPNVSLSILRPGNYRVDVSGDGDRTMVTVRSGEMEATSDGNAFTLHPHETVSIQGTGIDQSRQVLDLASADVFDRWCHDRDARDDRGAQLAHVPREVIGYEDLADYGRWEQTPQYGWAWAPSAVRIGWAPYHYGHWAWIEPWGWTWVDDAPWGFAPFHYGRWAFVSTRWLWVPGEVVHPIYAPALVAFAGGAHWQASISFGGGGGVAWFPLAPGEVYVPAYRVAPRYLRAVNPPGVNINVNITQIHYANQNVQGGITAVPREVFIGARSVGPAAVPVSRTVAASVVAAGSAPVSPQTASVLGRSPSSGRIVRPPANVVDRPVVAKITPPPPPVPFATRQRALIDHPGRPLDTGELQQIRPAAPARLVRPASPGGFTSPSGSAGASTGNQPAATVTPSTPTGIDRTPRHEATDELKRPVVPMPRTPAPVNTPSNAPTNTPTTVPNTVPTPTPNNAPNNPPTDRVERKRIIRVDEPKPPTQPTPQPTTVVKTPPPQPASPTGSSGTANTPPERRRVTTDEKPAAKPETAQPKSSSGSGETVTPPPARTRATTTTTAAADKPKKDEKKPEEKKKDEKKDEKKKDQQE
jgi:hypothetical protein